ncbi:hypothetical protein N0V90_002888 [Kalmusia sp. IMI 367209]|nr:hypothetical protein N0V90_002888 [Kalmusia sp. IMI 367209]
MRITLIFSLFSILNWVYANNEFTIPPPAGLDVVMDESVEIKWRCDDCGSVPVTLNLWQDKGDGGWAQEVLLSNVIDPGSYIWAPHTLEDLTKANGFHFNLVAGTLGFDSGAVFIRDALSTSSAPTSMSSSASSTTSTTSPSTSSHSSTTPSSSSSTSSIATTPSTSDPVPTNPSAGGSDDKATLKVGLGVGLGVGIPFILLVGGIIGYAVFRRSSRPPQYTPYETSFKHDAPTAQELPAATPVAEMGNDGLRHELPEQVSPKIK